jgi:hypothetical protein
MIAILMMILRELRNGLRRVRSGTRRMSIRQKNQVIVRVVQMERVIVREERKRERVGNVFHLMNIHRLLQKVRLKEEVRKVVGRKARKNRVKLVMTLVVCSLSNFMLECLII